MRADHLYDPFDPATVSDPYPAYARLRDQAPAAYLERYGIWVLSRYDDVVSTLKNPSLFSSAAGMADFMIGGLRPGSGVGAAEAVAGQWLEEAIGRRLLIASDPPDHTKLRQMVARPFSPRAIAAMEPRIRQICTELIDEMITANDEGRADLVGHLAYPLPVIVIAELLAIPPERREDFKRWSDDMVLGFGSQDPSVAMQSAMEMFQYFGAVVEERTASPGADVISLLTTAEDDGQDPLTSMEVLMFCALLLIAGNETTTNLLSNWMRALFDAPEQLEAVYARPELIASSLEEALRFDAPVQALFRATTAQATIDEVTIPKDARIMVGYAAANRDERRFARPDAFDITRNPTDHVAFGAGIHFCLGASLARLEARVAAEELLARTTGIEPSGPATPVDSFFLRGLKSMPVRLKVRD